MVHCINPLTSRVSWCREILQPLPRLRTRGGRTEALTRTAIGITSRMEKTKSKEGKKDKKTKWEASEAEKRVKMIAFWKRRMTSSKNTMINQGIIASDSPRWSRRRSWERGDLRATPKTSCLWPLDALSLYTSQWSNDLFLQVKNMLFCTLIKREWISFTVVFLLKTRGMGIEYLQNNDLASLRWTTSARSVRWNEAIQGLRTNLLLLDCFTSRLLQVLWEVRNDNTLVFNP
jgi:hypothetical protein